MKDYVEQHKAVKKAISVALPKKAKDMSRIQEHITLAKIYYFH